MPVTKNQMLTAHNISHIIGNKCLLNQLSLSVGAGDSMQIKGPNGTGKTTLLKILNGLLEPTIGSVLWRGKNILTNRKHFLENLCFIGHKTGIKPELTTLENLKLYCSTQGIQPANISTALDKMNLSEQANQRAKYLSAGQTRRLALSKLLIKNQTLWLLDEPLTALDVDGQSLLANLINQHTQNGGMIIFTSHQPLALKNCKTITLTMPEVFEPHV